MVATLFEQHHALIGASVRVECADQTFARGVLYCIDPTSDAVALLRAQSDDEDNGSDTSAVVSGYNVQIFMGHSVRAIHLDEQHGSTTTPQDSLTHIHERVLATTSARIELDSEAVQYRRKQLCALLHKHFVPCEDNGDNGVEVFGGAARVRAPFTVDSIESANEQILARLQTLVAQLAPIA